MNPGKTMLASAAIVLLFLSASFSSISVVAVPANIPVIIVGQTLTGNESVTLAGNVSNVTYMNVTLEGRSVGKASEEPFVVWIDTTEFSDGVHNLTVNITFNGGTTQEIIIEVTVDNQNWPLSLVALPLGALAIMLLLFTLSVGWARRKKGGEK
jgi:hypothetical protein